LVVRNHKNEEKISLTTREAGKISGDNRKGNAQSMLDVNDLDNSGSTRKDLTLSTEKKRKDLPP